MANVSGDGDGYAREEVRVNGALGEAKPLEDGAEVEQRLRRVLVHAVTSIEHGKSAEAF